MNESTKPPDSAEASVTVPSNSNVDGIIGDLAVDPASVPVKEAIPEPTFDPTSEAIAADFEEIPAEEVRPSEVIPDKPSPHTDRIGRPPGAKNRAKSVIAETPGAEQINQVDYAMLSSVVFDTGTSSLATLFGPEWFAKDDTEKQAVCMALSNYMKSKNMPDIPPGLMLCIVLIAYSSKRLKEPSTASKLSAIWTWIKERLNSFRRKPRIAIMQSQHEQSANV